MKKNIFLILFVMLACTYCTSLSGQTNYSISSLDILQKLKTDAVKENNFTKAAEIKKEIELRETEQNKINELQIELDKKVKAEDFEGAALIKEQLKVLKDKKTRKEELRKQIVTAIESNDFESAAKYKAELNSLMAQNVQGKKANTTPSAIKDDPKIMNAVVTPKNNSPSDADKNSPTTTILEPFIGVQLGFNLATIAFEFPGGAAASQSSITRFSLGANYCRKLSTINNLYFHLTLNLFDGKGTVQTDPILSSVSAVHLNYFSLSPEARYFLFTNQKMSIYGSFGSYLAYMMSGTIQFGTSPAQDILEGALNSFDWGLNFGAGTYINLKTDSKIGAGINYGLGIYNIEGDDAASKDQSSKNRVLSISVSYCMNISSLFHKSAK